MKSIIIYLLLLLTHFPKSNAQSIIKCDHNTSFWLIEDNTINYAVELHGDIAKSKIPDLINIEDKALQYIILDKIHFIKEGENIEDSVVLSRYVAEESEYLSYLFPKPFNVETQIGTLPSGKHFLLWWYKIPEGRSKEVAAQVFVNVIEGEILFGLGSPQFIDLNLEDIKTFLINTIATLSIIKNKNSLCNQ